MKGRTEGEALHGAGVRVPAFIEYEGKAAAQFVGEFVALDPAL